MAIPEGYTPLAKIGLAYKGTYASGTTYRQLDAVYYLGSTYLALIDNPAGSPNNDGVNWRYLAQGAGEDVSDSTVTFTQATTRTNINSGEQNKTIMGKIKKWFADLTAAAFSQMISSYTDLMANTASGYLLDALAVKEGFNEINSNFFSVKSMLPSDTLGNSLKLIYYQWSGNVIGGQTVDFGNYEDSVPSGYNFIGMFLTPKATVHISMSYYNGHVYAYSENYTGEIYYDVLILVH